MIVNRLGNKAKLAAEIIKHFPPHDLFIDMFFGAGGLFFNKPRAKYNICNDKDDEIYNLWMVLQTQKEDLIEAIQLTPISQSIFNYWKDNRPTEPVAAAVRFLFLSSMTFNGAGASMSIEISSPKKHIIERINKFYTDVIDVKFIKYDFREVIKNIHYRRKNEKARSFIYADPPYCETGANYQKFKKADTFDVFEVLENSGIRFALSEFDHPFVIDQAKTRRLNIIDIGERRNLKNRRMEILITNYDTQQKTLF